MTATLLTATGHHRGSVHASIMPLITDIGEDSVSPGGMGQGLDVYCGYDAGAPGYRNGSYSNMSAIKAMFPGKKYISVGYDAIDIETGLASAADARGFVNGWAPGPNTHIDRPMLYANGSTMPSVKAALSGIARDRYYLWVAAWDGSPSIPSGYDGKQYDSTSGYDGDSFYDYIFGTVGPPPPPQTFKAPTGLRANRLGTAGRLTWKAVQGLPGHPVRGYKIVIYNLPPVIKGGHWQVVKQTSTSSPTPTEATVYGLEIGKPYQAHVWAFGSPVSSEKNFASVNFGTG